MPRVTFSSSQAQRDERVTASVTASPGQYVASNLKSATWLIKVTGARIFAMDGAGNAVLEIQDPGRDGVARITVEATHPLPVVAGRILSLVGLLGLLGGLAQLVRIRRRGAAAI